MNIYMTYIKSGDKKYGSEREKKAVKPVKGGGVLSSNLAIQAMSQLYSFTWYSTDKITRIKQFTLPETFNKQ